MTHDTPDSASFPDHFSGVAADYARFRPHYPSALFDFLASLVPPQSHVWDCATGSGQAAVQLAERFAQVTATDASAEQIASAQPHPRVTYGVEPAERSSLADASVDLITVATGIHWFNHPAFFAEAERVLVPGGVLAAWCYGQQHVANAAVDAMIDSYYHTVVGPYWPPQRQLVEDGYSTIPFPFNAVETPGFAIEAELTLDEFLGYMRTWSARTAFITDKGFDPLPELASAMTPYWRAGIRLHVRWPIALQVRRK